MTNSRNNDFIRANDLITEIFGQPVSVYTRAQGIEDGVLVDVTAQAADGPGGMLGGFYAPVALTAAVWALIEAIPASLEGIADTRGRLHDVLWMARLAANRGGSSTDYVVMLPAKGTRKRNQTLRMVAGPGDAGELVITIGLPEDF